MENLDAKRFRFADFELLGSERVLLKEGKPLALTSKSFDLLMALVQRHGEVLSKDQLLEMVWPGQIVEEGNLTVHVSNLRKIFGEGKNDHKFIVTIPGRGYSFVAQTVEPTDGEIVIESHTSSTILIEEDADGLEKTLANRKPVSFVAGFSAVRQRWILIGLGFLGCALLLSVYVWQLQTSFHGSALFNRLQMRRLTSNGKVQLAALSVDGNLFVYALGTSGHPKSLWLGHTSGGDPIQLRPDAEGWYHSLHLSQDNSSVFYVFAGSDDAEGSLYRLPLLGGVPEVLFRKIKTHVAFSPDSTQIAFVKNDRDLQISTVVITDVYGRNQREAAYRTLEAPFVGSALAWSDDGRSIAAGAVSPSDAEASNEIVIIDAVSGSMKSLTGPILDEILSLAWCDDPNGVLAVGNRPPLFDAQLWHISYPSGEVRQVDRGTGTYRQSLGVSKMSNAVLGVQLSTLANIWVAPTSDLSRARQITFTTSDGRAGMYGLDWLPDGKIVFGASADKSQSLWITDVEGRNQRRLIPDTGVAQQPSASADGKIIVFASNRGGASEIWRVADNGSDLSPLTTGGHNDMPAVSPDGKWVVYVSQRQGSQGLWRQALDGGEPIKISDVNAAWPRISPDGRYIACASFKDGKTHLMTLPLFGGEPLTFFDVPKTANFRWSIRWTPDGTAIAYRDWENGYWLQPIVGGPPARMSGLPEEKLFAFAWSSDGKQFAFSRGPETRDVVLLQEAAK